MATDERYIDDALLFPIPISPFHFRAKLLLDLTRVPTLY